MAKYNWTKIQCDFLASGMSLAEFSRARGIPYNTLRERAKADEWLAQRDEYRQTVVAKTTNRLSNAEAKRFQRHIAASDALIEKIEAALADKDEAYIRMKDGEEVRGDQINTAWLRSIAELLTQAVKIHSELLGVLTEKEFLDIETQRMKIAAGEGTGSGGSGGVIVLPPVIGEADDD